MRISIFTVLTSIIGVLYAQTCQEIQCSDIDLTDNSNINVGDECLKSFSGSSTVLSSCNTYDKQYCHMTATSPMAGVCKSNATRFEFYPVEIALPGERCDPQRALYECGYGYRSCSAFRCLGFLENERCARHEDCNPGLFCDTTLNTCQKIKDLDNQCQQSQDCGRTATCIFLNSADANGKCTEYYTVPQGTSIYAKTEEDTFVCEDGYGSLTTVTGEYEYKIGTDFVAGSYECGKAILSEKAGEECKTSFDCYSSDGSVFAKCDCSSGSNSKICGILPGNEEWKDYFSSVKKYYKATKNCHGAQTFEGVCGESELNDKKQCKKAMAKNYIQYTGASECVKLYSNKYLFPEVNEVEEWCNTKRKYTLLGINSGYGPSISVLVLTMLTAFLSFSL
ncbi:unnamed protein product [Moneuplotes crassus]|uniref:Uncharacterized protein n=1 Tax=Euplotes crassus TaxID=5936 RepID=A0AAD1UMS9_EUPCR|nr:unnamed protein product [Moneuplotes crassus]